ncbi:peptidase S8/S53, subtilisin/kexin/sedolisin [Purpureocillium lilacinum]|uniref:Peptidase S8/S53, subtilisin/kexin/sedolisin n=1 Tax=Purpureocillium lilacinum TaxID=33203 RepID=A0A179GMS5_PURLI|nr:peptidase S8/S53, subtilisin/kexin/sedolisin [Purpureocillium lilacinum]GJN71538.1 hypothetical protein PLICBS_005604 [Purpureocillium lilacinum]
MVRLSSESLATLLLGTRLARGENRSGGKSATKYIVMTKEGVNPETVTETIARHADLLPLGVPGKYEPIDCGDIFRGLVVKSPITAQEIKAIDGVVHAWPAQPLYRDTASCCTSGDAACNCYSERREKKPTHDLTGVTKIHKDSNYGLGTKIAIIDSGIDYTRLDLGGCFGPQCKVVGGRDLVGQSWDPENEHEKPRVPGADPLSFFSLGTQAASIAAGRHIWMHDLGVAPSADLLAYKVFAENGTTTSEEVVIQAFCDAYRDGASVILSPNIASTSKLEPPHLGESAWGTVANLLTYNGVAVVLGAGDKGTKSFFANSRSGAEGFGILSVAAINMTWNDDKLKPRPAAFTSWGSMKDLLLKPDIGAPGVDIGIEQYDRGFSLPSGTAMAAPYVAGIAALYHSQLGGQHLAPSSWATDFAARVISGGQNVHWGPDDALAPPFLVGTGLVDAHKVLTSKTLLKFEPFALLDEEHFQPNWTFTIINQSAKKVKYKFSHQAHAAVELHALESGEPRSVEVPLNVHLPQSQRIEGGGNAQFTITFEPPKHDHGKFLYGGKIWIKGDEAGELCIPYGGVSH